MRLPVLLGLLSLIVVGFSGCSNDYQPGIANRGYVPGQALPTAQAQNNFAEKLR